MRAVVYRHFSLPKSSSASRHQSEELELLVRTVGPIHPNDGGRTHRRLARNMHPRCPKGRPRHARTHSWAKAIAKIEVWRASFDPNQRQGKMLEVECWGVGELFLLRRDR